MNRLKDLSIAALIAGSAAVTVSGIAMAAEKGNAYGEEDGGEPPKVSTEEVISGLKASGAQRILETEYEHEDGRGVYEVKYIDAEGRTREVYIDANNGKKLKGESEDE